jgi:guanosine-3',5'-bis(diphosphate) 3'-pyrophosphohydrolase
MRQFELVERVKSYDPSADEDAINRAYVYTVKMHGSQLRASGDPYFSHPVEVAGILTRYRLDTSSIITALLHDVIEDTDGTLDEIERLFGPEVKRLVDGVTKLAKIELQGEQAKQGENFRKLVLAMSEDIRVLLVKLADRLHNMRTLIHIDKPEKRRRIALETMEIYAPLSERIGIHEIKNELEDLAFAELHPEARASIVARLNFLREEGGDLVERIMGELQHTLAEGGLNAKVTGREKTPYSIWRKMQRKNVGFEQLADIMAIRVLVENMDDCYRALGILHCHYPVVPERFKDFISLPKPNGYRSLHTGIFGPERHRIEVQIRTDDMHEIAEMGVAAHWKYKQGDPKTDVQQYRWLRDLLDILEHAAGPEEFIEHTRLEMFQDQVFCFSPKGDLIALPRGAGPIDFAYAVHSAVGDRCVGAKINGRMRPLQTELNNGDQVEIITSKAQTPSPAWERLVVTGKAKSCIRRFVRAQQRQQYIEMGNKILHRAFKQEGQEYTEKGLDSILSNFKAGTIDDLCAMLGEGTYTGREVVAAVYPAIKSQPKSSNVIPIGRKTALPKSRDAIPIRGLIPGMAFDFAGCCHPLPGDRIVGIVSTGKGVKIHTIDCEMLEQFAETPERWLDVSWDIENDNVPQTGRVNVIVANEPGGLSNLSTAIAKSLGNIVNLKITNRSPDFFEMIVDIEVRDVRHLTNIIAVLRATPSISSVERARH